MCATRTGISNAAASELRTGRLPQTRLTTAWLGVLGERDATAVESAARRRARTADDTGAAGGGGCPELETYQRMRYTSDMQRSEYTTFDLVKRKDEIEELNRLAAKAGKPQR